MQISILLMEQIFELFLMILMGFIIVKEGIVKEEDSKVLSKIVLYLIIPCVIINAFQVDYTKKNRKWSSDRACCIRIASGGSPACRFHDGKTVFLK